MVMSDDGYDNDDGEEWSTPEAIGGYGVAFDFEKKNDVQNTCRKLKKIGQPMT